MEAARTILRRAFDDPKSRKKALTLLTPEHFTDRRQRWLFSLARHLDRNGPITVAMVGDFAARRVTNPKAVALLAEETGAVFQGKPPLETEFDYAMGVIGQDAQAGLLCAGLREVTRALSRGQMAEARELLKALPEKTEKLEPVNDRVLSVRTMRTLGPDAQTDRFFTGFQRIDEVTGGGRRGELWLWAAYTGELKSTMLFKAAHRCFLAGKKVFLVSLEMDRSEVMRRILTYHAAHLGLRLPFRDLEHGTTEETEKIRKQAAEDFDTCGDYGDLVVWEPPLGVTVVDVAREVERLNQEQDFEVVILDYVQKLFPVRERYQHREELKETMNRVKKLAQEARGRKGVWLFSGYQTSTEGRKRAEEQGYYDLWALSETLEAPQVANVVAWSLYTKAMRERKEAKLGLAKVRNGTVAGSEHYVVVDPAVGLVSGEPVLRRDDYYEFESEAP